MNVLYHRQILFFHFLKTYVVSLLSPEVADHTSRGKLARRNFNFLDCASAGKPSGSSYPASPRTNSHEGLTLESKPYQDRLFSPLLTLRINVALRLSTTMNMVN